MSTHVIFRYPGGKQKVAKQIVELIRPFVSDAYHDVCVGGGSVLCEMAVTMPNVKLYANDLDPNISSFWSLFQVKNLGYWDEFFELLSQKPTIKLFNHLRATPPKSTVERAYYGIFFNRTTFSGIQKGSPIGGATQQSKYTVDCRYNYLTLRKNIEYYRPIFCGRLEVSNEDMVSYVEKIHGESAIYIDPPYWKEGKKLYRFFPSVAGHQQLSEALRKKRNWVLSYDSCDEVKALYSWASITSLYANYTMHGRKTAHRLREELLITPPCRPPVA